MHVPFEDMLALAWFMLCWVGYALYAERLNKGANSLLAATNEYRLNWMRQMLGRDNRMVDASLIGNILRSISFFASTTIFIILGLFTLLKYRDEAEDIISAIPYASDTTPVMWEFKTFLLVVIFVYTFFKYTWSLRQYDYACIIVGAAPFAHERNGHFEEYARNAANMIGNAAKHFGMGLRGYYFGLAALAWFFHAYAFMLACTWVVLVLYRREFRSNALQYLQNPTVFKAD